MGIQSLRNRAASLMIGAALQDIVDNVELMVDGDKEDLGVGAQCVLGDVSAIAEFIQGETGDRAYEEAEKLLNKILTREEGKV